MRRLTLIIASFAVILVSATGVDAQSSRLSQLSFDDPEEAEIRTPKPPVPLEELKQMLDEESSPKPEPQKITPPPTPDVRGRLSTKGTAAAKTNARSSVRKKQQKAAKKVAKKNIKAPEPVRPKAQVVRIQLTGPERQLIPSLKGPIVDMGSSLSITSEASWKKPDKGSCTDVSFEADLCDKSVALKEVLRRFSGSDDFYQTHCSNQCTGAEFIPALAGFSVTDTRGGSFEVIERAGRCHYRMSRSETSGWLMLEGSSAVCSCLRPECL